MFGATSVKPVLVDRSLEKNYGTSAYKNNINVGCFGGLIIYGTEEIGILVKHIFLSQTFIDNCTPFLLQIR